MIGFLITMTVVGISVCLPPGIIAALSYGEGKQAGYTNQGFYVGASTGWAYARGYIAGVKKLRKRGPKVEKLSLEARTMAKIAEFDKNISRNDF